MKNKLETITNLFEGKEIRSIEDRLLLEVFGPCLPDAKVQWQQRIGLGEIFKDLKRNPC